MQQHLTSKKSSWGKIKNAVWGFVFLASLCSMPLQATESPKEKLQEWITTCPWIGLVAKEVSYGPITLRHLDFDGSGRMVVAKPGEQINGSVKYKVHSKNLDSWNLHHIILGIKGQDAQTCITHSVGVWDKKGVAHFTLNAPHEKGVYEVRFDHQEAALCGDAISAWKDEAPSSRATVGIIIVE